MSGRMAGSIALSFALLCSSGAEAQSGPSLMSSQTRAVIDAVSHNLEHLFKPKLVIAKGAVGPVTAMAVSDDEKYLITAVGDNSIRVWNLWVGREVARLPGHTDRITGIAVDRGGTRFVTLSKDRTVKIWNMRTLGQPTVLSTTAVETSSAVFLGDGNRLATAGMDGRVRIWSLPEGRQLSEFQAHEGGSVAIAATLDENRLVTGGSDGFIRLWDIASARQLAGGEAGSSVQTISASVADGRIAAGLADGSILILGNDGSRLERLVGNGAQITSVGFVPKSERLVFGDDSGNLRVWDLRRGKSEAALLGRHEGPITRTEVSADGGVVLSTSDDGTTKLWNLATSMPLLTLFSTTTGWAVVDAKGRYDGNEDALAGIEWRAVDATANIDDFAETYFQSALLARTLKDDGSIADAKPITGGVAYPPKVRIVSDTGDDNFRSVTVEVVAEDDRGGGVSEIRLYRNGKLMRGSDAVEQSSDIKKLVKRYKINVESGQTVVSATAVNTERLESRPESVTIAPGIQQKQGRIHLLTVGVNKYKDRSLDLFYARPDAVAIESYFKSGKTVMPVAETVMLKDSEATQANIISAIRSLRDVAQEDTVIIYIAGHGTSIDDEWYFISHDANLMGDVQAGENVGILSSVAFKAEVEALNADRILLLIDTCHSGAVVNPLKDYRGMKALRLLARTVGTHVLAATDHDQSAIEISSLGHGIFTYALLEGLNGKADYIGNGAVSATGLIRYIEETVPVLARKLTIYDQHPTAYSRGIDFPVARAEKTGR